MTANPTANNPRRVNVVGKRRSGHGFVFVQDGAWRIEHTDSAGSWTCCDLLIFGADDDERAVNTAVIRHLARKAHSGEYPQRLAGCVHAGGGQKVEGRWVKGPR